MLRSDITMIWGALREKSPFGLLLLMQLAMTLAFATWVLLIANFAKGEVLFDGAQYGLLQSVREIPGFLAFLVVYLLLYIREQWLAIIALLMLALAVAVTGLVPSFWGIMITTFVSSVGFHYFYAVYDSISLQWLPKATAPKQLGIIAGAVSFLTFGIYAVFTLWNFLGFSFAAVYMIVGLGSVALIVYAVVGYPVFPQGHIQNAGIVLRKRYWLFYLLQLLGGARRQIFVVFAGFMMVEHFSYSVEAMAKLLLATFLLGTLTQPLIGRLIARWGERLTLQIEYTGLAIVFASYTAVYIFDLPGWFAAILYLVDHFFFGMHIAMKTYFQKVADPADMASTAAVSFTINHIAAVFLPASLGLLWLISPAVVFGFALVLALASLGVAFLVPRHPKEGRETVLVR